MLQYLKWMWNEAPRALRLEFLITILMIEVLALATMLVLSAPVATSSSAGEESGSVSVVQD